MEWSGKFQTVLTVQVFWDVMLWHQVFPDVLREYSDFRAPGIAWKHSIIYQKTQILNTFLNFPVQFYYHHNNSE